MFSQKKSQAELITTILLILISIAAVVLVSGFIINMVRSNLVNTDCFKTTGQLKINLEDGYTYYNTTSTSSKAAYISISRGEADVNLTGLLISIGDGQSSTSYTLKKISGSSKEITSWDGNAPTLPEKSETRTYRINSTSAISKIKIVPIIYPEITCKEGADEQTIPSRG